jgi:hypothetical protein
MGNREFDRPVLTDDESELAIIISGLQKQGQEQERMAEKVKHKVLLATLGAYSTAGLAVVEHYHDPRNPEDFNFIAISVLLALGGIALFVYERKQAGQAAEKFKLARKLKQELEPTDLARIEECDATEFEQAFDDDPEEDDFYFA